MKTDHISPKEIEMNTNLNVRKQSGLPLAVLALLLAAAVLLAGILFTANLDGSLSARYDPNPRTKIAPQANLLDGLEQTMPRVRFAPLGGRKPPPAALEGYRRPTALEGNRKPAALEGGRRPAAQADIATLPAAPLTLVDGLVVLALAALLIVPAPKASRERI
jgi:hypothetical protein